jgi:hypothetical protein
MMGSRIRRNDSDSDSSRRHNSGTLLGIMMERTRHPQAWWQTPPPPMRQTISEPKSLESPQAISRPTNLNIGEAHDNIQISPIVSVKLTITLICRTRTLRRWGQRASIGGPIATCRWR